jgi:hypothetical protein
MLSFQKLYLFLGLITTKIASTWASETENTTSQIIQEEPLWQRLMTLPNAIGLGISFAILGLGFAIIKYLADDEGSKSLSLGSKQIVVYQ